MNILLTGGAGYIGSHAAIVLVEAGHNVVILDNFCNSNKGILALLKQILGAELKSVDCDVRDTKSVAKILNDCQIDAVMHFAGLKAVGESVAKPIEYYANNIQGTISLLEAMKLASIKTLVFSSSATVYGDPQYLPIDENHPTGATNPYGRTKLHIEEMLKDVSNSDPDWKIICLRYFNPVGSHQSGLIPEAPKGVPNNLMPYIAKVLNGEFPILNIYGNDYDTRDGTGVRDYIHVMDLADGHLAALNFLLESCGWCAINLGTGFGYTVLEIIRASEAGSGKNIPIHYAPRRPGDVASCYADVKKAKHQLGWTAKRSLKEMCFFIPKTN
jgi:UDP-glucose 4-epimerase